MAEELVKQKPRLTKTFVSWHMERHPERWDAFYEVAERHDWSRVVPVREGEKSLMTTESDPVYLLIDLWAEATWGPREEGQEDHTDLKKMEVFMILPRYSSWDPRPRQVIMRTDLYMKARDSLHKVYLSKEEG